MTETAALPLMTSFSHDIALPGSVLDNEDILSDEEIGIATVMQEGHQGHIFQGWSRSGSEDDVDKHRLFQQIKTLNGTCPGKGGILGYCSRVKRLLQDSADGINPLDGWKLSVAQGVTLDPSSGEYCRLEKIGKNDLCACGFIVIAGGLGERLGYNDIKLKLPVELCTSISYLELYCRQIITFQTPERKIPLAIMVSGDTERRTRELLTTNNYFGLEESQITFLKQNDVPVIVDMEGHLALDPKDPCQLMTKPHGHGDIHALMHKSGTAKRWISKGVKWVVFMQDTNSLQLYTLSAFLGVSINMGLAVNSLAIQRKAKEPIGGIARLIRNEDGREMVANVEYNQLDLLLHKSGFPKGDVNDPQTGFSPYPGNINILLFSLASYVETLNLDVQIEEFVNPKYYGESKTAFMPTRLECLMQDYPKIVGPNMKVGFTCAPTWMCFSALKNSITRASDAIVKGVPPMCAASAEADAYNVWVQLLRIHGAHIESAAPTTYHEGISVCLGPQIVIEPSIFLLTSELKKVFPEPSNIRISHRSSLVIRGEGTVVIEMLDLDGAAVFDVATGSSLYIKKKTIRNAGWSFAPLGVVEDEQYSSQTEETLSMRGYRLIKNEDETVQLLKGEERTYYENIQAKQQ